MNNLKSYIFTENELKEFGFKSLGKNIQVSNRASIYGNKHISIGSNVRIDDFATISAQAPVDIGSYVHIANQCSIIAGAKFTIGNFSTLSVGVRVFTHSDDYSGETMSNPTVPGEFKNVQYSAVTLGTHVIVGTNSVILPGGKLEDGVTVGAMSLVKTKLDSWGIYAGIPAIRIKNRSKNLLKLMNKLMDT